MRELIRHLADFPLDLGDGFAFIGRRRRLQIDEASAPRCARKILAEIRRTSRQTAS
ncbi:DUF1016 domain-containing protein [Cupriavidus basilensis]|nr:DUF1016 domain-containing protein [Cupriavidus basilensis]